MSLRQVGDGTYFYFSNDRALRLNTCQVCAPWVGRIPLRYKLFKIMTVKRIINVLQRVLCLLAFTTSFWGCIKEDLDDCNDRYSLTVRAYAYESGRELDADVVTDLSLFIFDRESRFLYKVETAIGQKVVVTGPKDENLYIVAWGNLRQGHQNYTDPQPGDPLADCFVELQIQTRSETYALSPGDLFRGMITLTADNRTDDKMLPIYREVGSLTVTIRNLKGFTGYNDEDFHIVVRETQSWIGFEGTAAGEKVSYLPDGSFAEGGNANYNVPAFNLLSMKSGVNIDIYHGSERITTVSTDREAYPITIEKGQLTNVLIELRASLGVSMELTDWGNNYIWKEF